MKKAFVAILSLAALVACSQDSVVKTPESTAISFDNMFVENKTRAAADPSTTTANIEEFAVWGFRGDAQELVFNNERVYKADGAWTYDHLQYWMEGKDYFFGAVSPVNHENVTVDTQAMSKDGLGTISFTNTDGSVDLIYAEKVVYASEINPSAPEKVKLQFAHLLSRVKFSFKYNFPNELTTVAVKNIKINNSPANGSIDVTDARADWSWNIPQNGATMLVDFGHVENGNEFAAMDTYYESDKYRLIIPTDETRNHDITFDVVVYNNHVEAETYSISTTLKDKAFVQGKSYNIVTEITPDNIVDGGLQPIEFEVIEVEEWLDENDEPIYPEDPEQPVDPEEPTPGYKLYLENVDGWEQVFVYAWDAEGTQILGEWPGVEMTEKETIDEVEYFAYTLSSELNGKTISVIFNNGNNGKQTADITGVELTKDNTFTNYVEPAKPTETKLYLKPNANWMADGARFSAYLWGNGVTAVWYDMTLVEGETDIYEFTLPEGYENIIFCRMNPSTTANDWNNKWNQTGDLKVPTDGKNLFTLADSVWDGATTTWDTYTPAEAPAEPEVLATPVVEASVEGNVVTLTWEAVENAAQYSITVGTEMPVFVEDTTYVFTGEYETEYTFNVVAVPADEEKFAASEAATAKATTEAAPVVGPTYTTVAEFLAAAEDETIYTLKGTITSVTETSYGNFYINDGTGEVLIYGLCSPEGAQKYWAQSGAKVGDDIVIKTVRTSYNSAPQGKNAIFVELITPGTLAFWSFEATSASFTAAAAEKTIAVAIYNATSEVEAVSDNAQFSAVYSAGVLTISAKENTTADAIEGNITVTCGDLSQVIAVSQLGASSGDAVAVEAKISFADKANRTEYSTSKQVWEQNGIVVTNNKGASTSNVGDYANPARFYKSSNVTIQAPGEIISISIDCKGLDAKYVTPWGTADNGIVTITLDGTSDTYTFNNLSAQARAYSMTVTYLE